MSNERPQAERTARPLGQTLLSCTAALGALCLVAAAASLVLGIRPLVFRSGSMAPTIDTGDLALAREVPASELLVGDIVSVPTGTGVRVTHRITELRRSGASATLVLTGDANTVADVETYTVSHADRVFFHVPLLGYLVAALSGPLGLLFGGGAIALALLAPPRRRSGRSVGRRRAARPSNVPTLSVLGLGLLGVGVALVARPPAQTLALFRDTAAVSTADSAFTAHTLAQPGPVTCTPGGGDRVTFTWPHADLRYSYLLEVAIPGGGAGSVVESFTTTPAASVAVDAPVSQPISLADVSSLLALNQPYDVRVWARVPGASHWISARPGTSSLTVTSVADVIGMVGC